MKAVNTFVVYLGETELTPTQHHKINTAIKDAFTEKLSQLIADGSISYIFSQKCLNENIFDDVVDRLVKEALVVALLSS